MSRKFVRQPFRLKAGAKIVVAILLVSAVAALAGDARAQDQIPPPPLPVDTTPLSELLSPSERAAIAKEQKQKNVVELYLGFSDAHLEAAMTAVKNGSSNNAERELDIYTKILAEATKITSSMEDGKRSVSKKMEQKLYKQLRTLETIERLFPSERLAFAEDAIKKAKQFRVQALNQAFAGGDVLKDPDSEKPPTTPPDKDTDRHPQPSSLREAALGRGAKLTVAFYQSSMSITLGGLHYGRTGASSQIPGDYLTEEEDDHVREAQKPEDRIKVFIKIADRRLAAIAAVPATAPDAKAQKKLEEEAKEWGVLPKLTRAELLRHYTRAIEEGMAKLEDAYERNPKSTSIPKALTALRDATDRHLQTLKSLESEMKGETESAALKDAIEQAQAANKGARDGLKGK